MRRLLVLGCLVAVGCATAATEQPPPQIVPPAAILAPALPAPVPAPQPAAPVKKPKSSPVQSGPAAAKPSEPLPAPPQPTPAPPPLHAPTAPAPRPIAKPAEPSCAGRLKRECLAGCAWVPGSTTAGRVVKGYCEKAGPLPLRSASPPPRNTWPLPAPQPTPVPPADGCKGLLKRDCAGLCRWVPGTSPANGVTIRGYCSR